MIMQVYCWRSFLILSQIILESYSQFPDVDLVESDIRVISEGYPQNNHGNRQQVSSKTLDGNTMMYWYERRDVVQLPSISHFLIRIQDHFE